jgi:hypothetical protein
MNLRHPKVVRLGGFGAGVTTLLAIAAGTYLAATMLQAGDLLNGGIIAGMTVAFAVCGGLLSYCLFSFSSMQVAAAKAPAAEATTAFEAAEVPEASEIDELTADVPEEIAISATDTALSPMEHSDEGIPVFAAEPPPSTFDIDGDDFDPDLLVVPPPLEALDDSDSIAVERSVTAEAESNFDSSMDLPVTIDLPEPVAEGSDDIPPVVQTQTSAVVSAMTQTDEVDVMDLLNSSVTAGPMLPESAPEKPSPVEAFPDIFKSTPLKTVSPKAAPAVPNQPAKPTPVQKAPAAEAKPAAAPRPEPSEAALPVVDDLSDIAVTLGPMTQTGVLPTEIPDFFLKMPTGRSMPTAKPAMPVAPVAPRQVAPPKPAPAQHAHAAVRIIDSTTTGVDDDLVTMTSIPDDWPS